MSIIPFSFDEQAIRVLSDEGGEPWFVAADVCVVLEIQNTTQALARLDEEERSMLNIDHRGDVNVINESGLYSLILGSRKPEAKKFKRWVTSEVLPAIRKTGRYAVAEQPVPRTLSEALRLAADLEDQKVMAEAQRDEAIRTKALIGSRREASAMGKASAAVREANKLRDQLGFNARHATVTAVENVTKEKYEWLPLRKWCKAHGVTPETIPDKRYGEVKAWLADAWGEVYGVDLSEVFAVEVCA